jgi:hypothetical protein
MMGRTLECRGLTSVGADDDGAGAWREMEGDVVKRGRLIWMSEREAVDRDGVHAGRANVAAGEKGGKAESV